MSDGSYGLGNAYSDTLRTIGQIFQGQQQADTAAATNQNIEQQLSETQKINKMVLYASFALLILGGFAAIKKSL